MVAQPPHGLKRYTSRRRYASSRHSEVVAREGARVLRDLGSTNGTHVDGLAIAGERVLADGDLVRIGETELRYEA